MATLGSQAVGSTVKLNVNGTARNFIVVNQGLPGSMYDSSCDGTWLLMQDIYANSAWDSTNNDYANSDIRTYLNSTFLGLLDSGAKRIIKTVKIPYTNGTGPSGSVVSGSNGLSTQIFLLSYTEVGLSGSSFDKVEGAVLSYFNRATNSKRIAYLSGKASQWWLRTPSTTDIYHPVMVNTNGTASEGAGCANAKGVRPALILPSETEIDSDGNVIVPYNKAIDGTINIAGVKRELTGNGYINIGGVLRELSDSQVDIGGILKSLKG